MFIPIYNKTTYSFLSSLLNIDDLIEIALNNKLDSIAICDNNLFGAMEFIRKCEINNINPIIGLDLTSRILYAKNYQGYQNLLKLYTLKTERELEEKDYFKYKDNLICIPLTEIEHIYETEFIPNDITKENGIYFKKILYKEEKDYETLKYLELLRDNKTVTNEYEEKRNCYYKQELTNKLVENTYKFSKMCNLKLPEYKLDLPKINEMDSISYLKTLSLKGLSKRLGGNISNTYLERLNYELDIIIRMGFTDYFLIVYDYIKYAKSNNILVGPGRGSAAGSLVSYTLGITDIDPLKYDLLFERFLNPERVTMPDIDTDFPDIYRAQVINYVTNKYGNKHVSGIVTFQEMKSKLCVRDIGRVMNISLPEIDEISKIIGSRKEPLKEILATSEKLQMLVKSDTRIKKLIEVSIKVEGVKRHTSVHAAGIIISKKSLDEIVPLTYDSGTNQYICGYEASYLESLGLLKMDFLGIKNLTTIMEIINNINLHEKDKISFKDIPLTDPKTIELFQNAETNGIFQFESSGMKQFLKELKPANFMDISAGIALFRPASASYIPMFIKRKEGLEKIDYYSPSLENILKPTYGVIIYQEQIMQIARTMASFSLADADILRRAISKKNKDLIENYKTKFIKGALKNCYQKDLVLKIYNLILEFASYGFNKSHSVAYSIIAFKMAYLKANYKKYFYVSLLDSVIGDIDKTKDYLYEVKKHDIKILKPNINLSINNYKIMVDSILCPFSIIKGINKSLTTKIIDNREDTYKDIYDFLTKNNDLTKNNLEILIKSGSLDVFNYNRKTLITNLDSLFNYANLLKEIDPSLVLKPEIIETDKYDNNYITSLEKELYGFYISNHPVLNYKSKYPGIVNLTDIENYFNKRVNLIVLVEKIRVINTKKGELMMFFSGSDEEMLRDFTMFPAEYKLYANLEKGDIIKVYGKIEKRYGTYQIIVSKIEKLN